MIKGIVPTCIFLFFLSVMSCNSEHQIDIQGHRGSRGLLPENTIPAFEKALNLGVTTLELDIAITKDNKVVVSHEPYMNPLICLKPDGSEITKDDNYNLYQMTYDSIKQFDCGTKLHPRFPKQKKIKVHKPLLSEVFNLVKRKNQSVKFNIEIKSEPHYYGLYTPQPRVYVDIVLKAIKNSGLEADINVQSFDVEILREVRRQNSKMPIALLVDENESIQEKMEDLNVNPLPEIISPYYKLLNQKTISQLQNEGFKVIPWTINDIEDMGNFVTWKVDGIITDYPNELVNLLK